MCVAGANKSPPATVMETMLHFIFLLGKEQQWEHTD